MLKGMKKSNSDSKIGLSDRLSFTRKSKHLSGVKSIVNSPLPPRPLRGSVGNKTNCHGKACENIPENIVCGSSLHSPGHHPGIFDNVKQQEPLHIKGKRNAIMIL